jgi:Heterokaryon incompatibility protein (HET)
MRLLNATTFEFEEFAPKEVPDYAILSHTWAMEEVLYHDILNHTGQTKLGWSKVKSCCRRTREDGFEYVWIDTCCT